jgi:hypothetical protein
MYQHRRLSGHAGGMQLQRKQSTRQGRRLAALKTALPPAAARAAAAAAPQSPRFRIGAGGLSPEERARVLGQLDAAVAARDFREAASLQDVVRAFGPDRGVDLARAVETAGAPLQAQAEVRY